VRVGDADRAGVCEGRSPTAAFIRFVRSWGSVHGGRRSMIETRMGTRSVWARRNFKLSRRACHILVFDFFDSLRVAA
jgi:hypothetical protein